MKDLASAIAIAESLVDFRNLALHDGEKSRPKEKKFENKPIKDPFGRKGEGRLTMARG